MVPAGAATDATVMKLASLMEPGDIIIDGGNSYFQDDIRRSKAVAAARESSTSTSAPVAASGVSTAAIA